MKKLLFIPILLMCSLCYADVSGVSGTTISGSSFGTKTQAQPLSFDGFEDGVIDTTPDIGTNWQSTYLTELTTSGGVRHSGSSYHGGKNFTTDGTVGVTSNNSVLSEKWYVSWWWKVDSNWDWGDGTCGDDQNQHLSNIKVFRVWNPGAIDENFVVATQGWGDTLISNNEYIGPSNVDYFEGNYQTNWTKNTWHHFQFEYSENSAVGESDGIFRMWRDGVLVQETTDLETREDYSELKRVSLAGFYNSWGANDLSNLPDTFYIDDIYVDTTWSRVEVGNNALYGSCTHREIQIPTSWSDTSITVSWNQGSFANNETCYLFVVDSDGTASTGYQGYFVDGTFYGAGQGPLNRKTKVTNVQLSNISLS